MPSAPPTPSRTTCRKVSVPSAQVASEDGDRVVAGAGDVDVQIVRRDHDAARHREAVDAADAVDLALREGERAGRRIAIEDDDRIVVLAGGVDPCRRRS